MDKDPKSYPAQESRGAPGPILDSTDPGGEEEASETEEAIASLSPTATPGSQRAFEEPADDQPANDRRAEAVPGIGGDVPAEYGETPALHARKPIATRDRMPEVGAPPINPDADRTTIRTPDDRIPDPSQRRTEPPEDVD